jgi:hypothetical protein
MPAAHSHPELVVKEMTALIYELLDAHSDTVQIAEEPSGDLHWDAHVEYLRDLQRVGRETLARLSQDGATPLR